MTEEPKTYEEILKKHNINSKFLPTNEQPSNYNQNNIRSQLPQGVQIGSEDDADLLKFIEESKPKVYVVGAGGGGCNTLTRVTEIGIQGVNLVATNTDVQHLVKTHAKRKILMGKKLTQGLGAGSNPEVGENAAKESMDEIKAAMGDASLVFVTCGLGGGTGTGSLPVIAQAAKAIGALTIAVVTLPFSSEGRTRMHNALQGLEKLQKQADTTIVIPNDKLLTIAPDLPLNTAFKVSDEVLAGAVKGIAELITKPGMVNLDFADLKTILKDAGCAVIGIGEASIEAKADQRAIIAIETALNSPLLDIDITTADRALINVVGGEDMSLKEAEIIMKEVSNRISPSSHIIWGARIEDNLKKSTLRVLVVVAGTKMPKYTLENLEKKSVEEELDLDLVG
ncbi:cell division protein FtsZ [Candidatus Micrarchaeota archaeon]|nr:cell division protein FtsZ [Candidatus Micrarchaeota archaeon]